MKWMNNVPIEIYILLVQREKMGSTLVNREMEQDVGTVDHHRSITFVVCTKYAIMGIILRSLAPVFTSLNGISANFSFHQNTGL